MKGLRKTHLSAQDKETGRESPRGRDEAVHVGKHGKYNAMVKVTNGITLTYGYQSVRLDVGVELPFDVDKENTQDAFARATEIVDDELAERSKEMDGLLKDLAKKYRK